ncbi:hypothetical protein SAE02_72310 [Skermanella aerolata]|uniref:Uncharacterized protein n=1 Tax=Skermanella aerolata TaxID=393310 RepID=A0A512E2X8_9PROT|nr:hypothetical protein SAE02_72310 [Skermanella aerolata]
MTRLLEEALYLLDRFFYRPAHQGPGRTIEDDGQFHDDGFHIMHELKEGYWLIGSVVRVGQTPAHVQCSARHRHGSGGD